MIKRLIWLTPLLGRRLEHDTNKLLDKHQVVMRIVLTQGAQTAKSNSTISQALSMHTHCTSQFVQIEMAQETHKSPRQMYTINRCIISCYATLDVCHLYNKSTHDQRPLTQRRTSKPSILSLQAWSTRYIFHQPMCTRRISAIFVDNKTFCSAQFCGRQTWQTYQHSLV